jgi:hypothetical protein
MKLSTVAPTEEAEVQKLLSVLLKFSQRGCANLGKEFLDRYSALTGIYQYHLLISNILCIAT